MNAVTYTIYFAALNGVYPHQLFYFYKKDYESYGALITCAYGSFCKTRDIPKKEKLYIMCNLMNDVADFLSKYINIE